MSEVQLIWPNKELTLRASGVGSYEWLAPTDERLATPLQLTVMGPDELAPRANAIVIAAPAAVAPKAKDKAGD